MPFLVVCSLKIFKVSMFQGRYCNLQSLNLKTETETKNGCTFFKMENKPVFLYVSMEHSTFKENLNNNT